MATKADRDPIDFWRRCSCGGPHGLAVYLDAEDGMVTFMDEHYRYGDVLDLRAMWQRVKAAWWVLSGQHFSYADMVLANDDVRAFADLMVQAADRHDAWRGDRRAAQEHAGRPAGEE
jgi:hypothetical protein